jgi:hypothetical protein
MEQLGEAFPRTDIEVRAGPDLPIVDTEITVGTRMYHQSVGVNASEIRVR